MTPMRARSMGAVCVAAACAAVLGTTPALRSGLQGLIAEVELVAGEGFIMGGSGNPTPDADYISNVEKYYLPGGYDYHPLTTPEQFCPFICGAGEPNEGFGDSVTAGVAQLDTNVTPLVTEGTNVSVLGYSQSATDASQWMNELIDSHQANLSDLHVTLLGDPNSPIGGILDRFQFPDGVGAFSATPEPQHIPFLDIPMSLEPTPTSIATDIYTAEYDAYANFPEDPSNILADANALLGIETVHPYYPDPTPGVNLDVDHMINLGKLGETTFFEIPAPLPMLAFMYDGGPAGQFFYDAFSPYATLVDDWGYGNPGDPFVGVNGTYAIGPWQVDATGQLMASGVDGFFLKMDPLQMLAGMEYAAAQTFIGPTDDLLRDVGQPILPDSAVTSMLSLYELTNQLDQSILTTWTDLTASMPSLAPDAVFDGSPLISAQPLIDLVGYGFDAFNFFGA
jgi:hypothetical protein